MKKKTPVIRQDPESPVATEILAAAVVALSKAATDLLNGPLKRRAILVLLRDATGHRITLAEIGEVLDASADLKKLYVK